MKTDTDPIDRLVEEHTHALTMLDRLERAATVLEEKSVDADATESVREALQFISSSVREHNEAEERALFPLLGERAPTTVFVEEHDRLRSLERELELALGGSSIVRPVPRVANELIGLLRDHIQRENDVLFPLARQLLSEEDLREVVRRREEGSS